MGRGISDQVHCEVERAGGGEDEAECSMSVEKGKANTKRMKTEMGVLLFCYTLSVQFCSITSTNTSNLFSEMILN